MSNQRGASCRVCAQDVGGQRFPASRGTICTGSSGEGGGEVRVGPSSNRKTKRTGSEPLVRRPDLAYTMAQWTMRALSRPLPLLAVHRSLPPGLRRAPEGAASPYPLARVKPESVFLHTTSSHGSMAPPRPDAPARGRHRAPLGLTPVRHRRPAPSRATASCLACHRKERRRHRARKRAGAEQQRALEETFVPFWLQPDDVSEAAVAPFAAIS